MVNKLQLRLLLFFINFSIWLLRINSAKGIFDNKHE